MRYSLAMFWLAAAILTTGIPHSASSTPTGAIIQARATVRIISGARIHLDGQASADTPPASDGVVHTEGAPQPARLIEFQ